MSLFRFQIGETLVGEPFEAADLSAALAHGERGLFIANPDLHLHLQVYVATLNAWHWVTRGTVADQARADPHLKPVIFSWVPVAEIACLLTQRRAGLTISALYGTGHNLIGYRLRGPGGAETTLTPRDGLVCREAATLWADSVEYRSDVIEHLKIQRRERRRRR